MSTVRVYVDCRPYKQVVGRCVLVVADGTGVAAPDGATVRERTGVRSVLVGGARRLRGRSGVSGCDPQSACEDKVCGEVGDRTGDDGDGDGFSETVHVLVLFGEFDEYGDELFVRGVLHDRCDDHGGCEGHVLILLADGRLSIGNLGFLWSYLDGPMSKCPRSLPDVQADTSMPPKLLGPGALLAGVVRTVRRCCGRGRR